MEHSSEGLVVLVQQTRNKLRWSVADVVENLGWWVFYIGLLGVGELINCKTIFLFS